MVPNKDLHRRHRGTPSSRKQAQISGSRQHSLNTSKKKYQIKPHNFSTRRAIVITATLFFLSYAFLRIYKPERNEVTTQLITNIPSYDEAHALALSELKAIT